MTNQNQKQYKSCAYMNNTQSKDIHPKDYDEPKWQQSTQTKDVNWKENDKDSYSLYTGILLPPSVCNVLCTWSFQKYKMLPSRVSNRSIALHIAFMATVLCAQASVSNLESLFTTCWMMGMTVLTICFLWCAGSLPCHSTFYCSPGRDWAIPCNNSCIFIS